MTAPPVPATAVAPALRLRGVTRTFGTTVALDDVDLEVHRAEVHCVLGENGAGKSTLCNVVFGALRPTSGEVERDGVPFSPASPAEAVSAGVTMVHQHFSLLPNLSVRENLLLGRKGLRLDGAGLDRRLAQIEADYGLRVDLAAPTGALSVGARQQVEIVKALVPDPALVLFDEPTGVLGPDEVQGFLTTVRRIADAGTAVVLITHKLAEVMAVGDRATVLRGGRVVGGGRLDELTSDDLVSLMIGRDVDGLDPVLAANLGLAARGATAPATARPKAAGPTVLEVRDLVVDRPDGARAVDHLDLTVPGGVIVGIAGVEGNGQSELVSVLSGGTSATAGSVLLDGAEVTRTGPGGRTSLGLGVIPEDRHHDAIVAELSVAENLLLGRLDELRRFGMLDRRAMRRRASDLVSRFDVRAAGTDVPMSSLSGGNQQKAVLARELSLEPLRCVVAAHPTRGLDLGAVDGVVRRLREAAAAGVAVLVVSSELSELLALCDVVHVAYRGRLLGPVPTDDPTARDQVARLMTGADA